MDTKEYEKLMTDVKYKVYDMVDKITDDYIEGFVEAVDCEITNIKENKDFYQNLYFNYLKALSFACEEILKLQGYSKTGDDFIEKRIELENEFLEKKI